MDTKPSSLKPGTSRWRDRRNDRAGKLITLAGTSQAQARAMGYGRRRAQKVRAGDHTGVPQRTLEALDCYLDCTTTTPWPLIGMQVEHVMRRLAATWHMERLRSEWIAACELEARKEGKVNPLQLCLREGFSRRSLEGIYELAPIQANALYQLSGQAGVLLEVI